MQLMPDTARRFGVTNAFDPRQNIFGGVQYLRFLLDMFRGDVALAAAGYNAGENAVARYGGIPPYKETRGYVAARSRRCWACSDAPGGTVQAAAAFFTPDPAGCRRPAAATASAARRQRRGAARASGKLAPARPRIYYKWTDDAGGRSTWPRPRRPRASSTRMIRALDCARRAMRDPSPRAPFDQGLFLTHFNKGKALYDEQRLRGRRARAGGGLPAAAARPEGAEPAGPRLLQAGEATRRPRRSTASWRRRAPTPTRSSTTWA